MADKPASTPLKVSLFVLTMVSGLVDAVCYLGLGHVFTANMTGNIVVLGFAIAGAPGFSVTATLTSLALFLAGAWCAGWGGSRLAASAGAKDVRHRLLTVAMATEACFVGAAALAALLAHAVSSGWARYVIIALLAFAMGVRNATVRRLAVPDMTTTVLTMTLTGLAADAVIPGAGHRDAQYRRLSAVAAMLAGAISGAALYLHQGAALPLFIVMLTVSGAGVALWLSKTP